MGSPISSIIAEIYLQSFSRTIYQTLYRKWTNIILQRICGHFNHIYHNKTNENSIMYHMNNIHKYVEFKLTLDEKNKLLRSHHT
jgi:hypothetical protein